MAISRANRLANKRNAEKKRRQRIQADPNRLATENEKRRKRYAVKKHEPKLLSDRAKRYRRKQWFLNKRQQRARKEIVQMNDVQGSTNSSNKTVQAIIGKKKRKQNRAVLQNLNVKLQTQLSDSRRVSEKYRVKCHRLNNKSPKSKSPRSCVNRELKRDKENVSEKVRKNLIFGKALAQDIKDSYSSISKKDKGDFSRKIALKSLVKYRFMNKAKPFYPVDTQYRRSFGVKKKNMKMVADSVVKFLENDENSTMAPGKKDCITRKKVCKQKRYLNHSMQYLHKRYCLQNEFVITYSAFCKLRPFWIVWKKVEDRDTCLCLKHENIEMVFKRLKEESILNHGNLDEAIENDMCCKDLTNECILRQCEECCSKTIAFQEFEALENTYYNEWETELETSEQTDKVFRKTVKRRVDCTKYDLAQHFLKLLPDYLKHLGILRHQTKFIKTLKNCLTKNDLLLHIDFSENYSCKFGREPQAIHFGGNRQQISLHTVMSYNDEDKKSYCTASKDLDHGPIAIFAHLKPIFDDYVGHIENLYFLSDSPSSQYRNRSMFFVMFNYIIPLFPKLKTFQWNYSESGHGKGAPDGIGAAVKRLCDNAVANGKDVSNFEKFCNVIESCETNVTIIPIPNATNLSMKNAVKNAPAVKGSMKVHQVTWFSENPSVMNFNTLSRFSSEHDVCILQYSKKSDPKKVVTPKTISSPSSIPTQCVPEKPICQNVTMPLSSESLSEGDWVIVRYPLEDQKGFRKYIGQILNISIKDGYLMDFVRSKNTRKESGYIYIYPNVRDNKTRCQFSQIIQKLNSPTTSQRSLKFEVHSNQLL